MTGKFLWLSVSSFALTAALTSATLAETPAAASTPAAATPAAVHKADHKADHKAEHKADAHAHKADHKADAHAHKADAHAHKADHKADAHAHKADAHAHKADHKADAHAHKADAHAHKAEHKADAAPTAVAVAGAPAATHHHAHKHHAHHAHHGHTGEGHAMHHQAHSQMQEQINAINAAISKVAVAEVKFGGRVKADFMYDIESRGPEFYGTYGLDAAKIPLRHLDTGAHNKGHFLAGLKGSRINAEAKKDCGCFKTRAFLEFDLNSNYANMHTGSVVPRLRLAFVEINNWTIGQTWFTFYQNDEDMRALDNNYGTSRQPQIRYTMNFNSAAKLDISMERPNTQYFRVQGTNANFATAGTTFQTTTTNNFNSNNYYTSIANLENNENFGKSQMPDFAARFKYTWCNDSFVTLAGLLRSLRIKSNYATFLDSTTGTSGAGPNTVTTPRFYGKARMGWGAKIASKIYLRGKNGVLLSFSGGKGIGQYIDDMQNASQDLYWRNDTGSLATRANNHMDAVKAYNGKIGLEIWPTCNTNINLLASYTKIHKPSRCLLQNADTINGGAAARQIRVGVPRFSTNLQRYFANAMYHVIQDKCIVGVEFAHFRRVAGTGHVKNFSKFKGHQNRVMFSTTYNF